jgi:protein required for attachment to host cells
MIIDRDVWILLANATHARVCVRDPADGRVQQVASYAHEASRLKAQELAFDRPGHVEKTEGSQRSGTALNPRADPRRKEHQHFARELAEVLEQGLKQRRCRAVVLMASNPFLGELKAELGEATRRALHATVSSDFTALDGPQLQRRLGEVLGELRPSPRP